VTIIRETLRTQGIRGLYAGCTALIVGNSVKAGVRFVAYDKFKQALADKDVSSVSFSLSPPPYSSVIDRSAHRIIKGKVSAAQSLLAGLGAGMVEAVIAVTPSETIKYISFRHPHLSPITTRSL